MTQDHVPLKQSQQIRHNLARTKICHGTKSSIQEGENGFLSFHIYKKQEFLERLKSASFTILELHFFNALHVYHVQLQSLLNMNFYLSILEV